MGVTLVICMFLPNAKCQVIHTFLFSIKALWATHYPVHAHVPWRGWLTESSPSSLPAWSLLQGSPWRPVAPPHSPGIKHMGYTKDIPTLLSHSSTILHVVSLCALLVKFLDTVLSTCPSTSNAFIYGLCILLQGSGALLQLQNIWRACTEEFI